MQRKMAAATCGRSETKLTIIWIQDWSWLGPCDGIAGGPAFIRVGPSIDPEGRLKRGVACLYILHPPSKSTRDIRPLILPAITTQQMYQSSKCSNELKFRLWFAKITQWIRKSNSKLFNVRTAASSFFVTSERIWLNFVLSTYVKVVSRI
jgi:hypothetical protein